MDERTLIKIYKVGRMLGYLPNTQKMNEYIYDELINHTQYVDVWYSIYGTYSSTGILEYKFQEPRAKEEFTRQEVKYLLEDCSNDYYHNRFRKYLKNKRSKY